MTAKDIMDSLWLKFTEDAHPTRDILSYMDSAVTGEGLRPQEDIKGLLEIDSEFFPVAVAIHNHQKDKVTFRPDPEREKYLCRDRGLTGTFSAETPVSVLFPLAGKTVLIETGRITEKMLGKTDWAADGCRPAVRGILMVLTNYICDENTPPQQHLHFYYLYEKKGTAAFKYVHYQMSAARGWKLGEMTADMIRAAREAADHLASADRIRQEEISRAMNERSFKNARIMEAVLNRPEVDENVLSVREMKALLPWTFSYLEDALAYLAGREDS